MLVNIILLICFASELNFLYSVNILLSVLISKACHFCKNLNTYNARNMVCIIIIVTKQAISLERWLMGITYRELLVSLVGAIKLYPFSELYLNSQHADMSSLMTYFSLNLLCIKWCCLNSGTHERLILFRHFLDILSKNRIKNSLGVKCFTWKR